MKHYKNRVSAIAGTVAICLLPALAPGAAVTFESVPLGAAGYDNGSSGPGGFDIGGVNFNNNYNATFGSWSGFSISNNGDTVTPSFGNQYSAWPGGGAGGSAQFAVGYYSEYEAPSNFATFGALTNLAGLGASFANTTYTALSMRDGGGFGAKKFGGATGADPDFLLLTIDGLVNGVATGTSVGFYLADFRSPDSAADYIVNDWRFVDFSPLGTVDQLRFSLTSSDVGAFGINTPTYFAMDNFATVPEPSSFAVLLGGAGLLLRRNRRKA